MSEGSQCPVIKAWLEMPCLVERAGGGRMAHVHKDELDRQTVIDNAEILDPDP